MKTVTFDVHPRAYILGFGHMGDETAKASALITEALQSRGVAARFAVGRGGNWHFHVTSGEIIVNGVHYRGMNRGRTNTFHSGWISALGRYGQKPFRSIEAFARTLLHETWHGFTGPGHTSNNTCLMHPYASNWPCPSEIAQMQRVFGTYTPPRPPEPVDPRDELLEELAAAKKDRDKACKACSDAKKKVSDLEKKLSSMTAGSMPPEVYGSVEGEVVCGIWNP